MGQEQPILFGPFRLDVSGGRLWRGEREISLRARASAVLGYLVAHPGRVIPREELAQYAWPGTHVSKTTLRGCVWEIRQALGEQAAAPQYIETVGQQGYRFVAKTRDGQAASGTEGALGALPRRVKKLMRLRACSISRIPKPFATLQR